MRFHETEKYSKIGLTDTLYDSTNDWMFWNEWEHSQEKKERTGQDSQKKSQSE